MTLVTFKRVEELVDEVLAEPRPPRLPGRFQMPTGAATFPANDNSKPAAKPRFLVTWFDEIESTQTKDWLIEGAFGVGEMSDVVGKPGSGKSAIVTDAACHVGAGMSWHGRPVKRGLVIYFAAERKKLTERRMAAFRKHHGVKNVALAVLGGKLDMTRSTADVLELVRTIKPLEAKCGVPCVWIILDTLTRTFGGGDQNASKDMTRYVQSADELIRETGAHVTIIHHTPWNEERGKGAIDLDGAVDASFIVKKSAKSFSLVCDGTNDGDEGPIIAFRLESVDLGEDDKGNVTRAPVVVPVVARKLIGNYEDAPPTKPPTGQTAAAVDAMKAAIVELGECAPAGSPGFPEGVRLVKREDWEKRFVADSVASGTKPESAARSFRRAATSLIKENIVAENGLYVWPADKRT